MQCHTNSWDSTCTVFVHYCCCFAGGQQYYLAVKFKNLAGHNAVIKSSDNNPAKGWTVKNRYVMSITKGTMSAQPITLVAVDETGKPLTLNGKMEFPLTPQTSKDKPVELVIGTQSK